KDKALVSAIGFVNWITESFQLDIAAIDGIESGKDCQQAVLQRAIGKALRERAVPIWMVSKQDLFAAYSHPPLKSRKDLRKAITSIGPVLEGASAKVFVQDAAAVGLYVQTERHFIIN